MEIVLAGIVLIAFGAFIFSKVSKKKRSKGASGSGRPPIETQHPE